MENLHVSQKQLSYHRVRGQNFLAVLFVATIFLSSLGYSFESTIGLADLIDDFTSNLTKPSGVPVTKTSTPTSNTSGVKIFQTKQGYTLLICNGYRYSKISTSSNGKKVYWRCTLRSCKGKVHTDVGGGVVYESTHDHPPMAEEFLFSCHSNRLAKEARQIMRFDPMKCLKDDAPYSALESTPTFCKIKDCLNVRSKNFPSAPNSKKDGLVGPTMPKPALPVPALTANPTPALKITPSRDGSLSVQSPTNGLLTELNTLRLTQNLCDVALCVSGTIIYAHRVVLAAASQYFRLLFLSNTKLLSYVELRGVKPESVELLVNYAYTGNLEINYNRVTELLTAANLLQFNPVVEKCCDYLRTQINVTNCINMREYAATQGLTKLQDLIDKYVCLHWEKVIAHDEIYNARPETLLHFLGDDELAVDNEADVYKVIITWVRKSPLYRQFYVGELLRKVRFVQLNAQFLLDNIESEELIRQHRDCEALLHRAKNHFLLPDRDHGLEEYHFRKRKRKNNVCLFGREGNITVGYEYNTVKCTAKKLCSVELDNGNYALINSADSLYLVGGESCHGQYLADVIMYNHRDNTWSDSPELKLTVARSEINATRVGIQIYLCGGMSTAGPCDTVEVIDVLTNCISEVKSLPEALAGVISCVVNNDIFVTGGRTEKGNNYSFYMYNHSLQLWTDLPKIPVDDGCNTRVTAMLHNVDGMIYVVMSDSSLYRFDVTTRSWNLRKDTNAEVSSEVDGPPSSYHTTCTTNGDIFAIRSRNDKIFLDRFDGSSITWSTCYSVDLPILVDAICPKPAD